LVVDHDEPMASPTPTRELAQTLIDTLLSADPFAATGLGLREYDALLPDPTAAAEDELSHALAGIGASAESVVTDDPADQITLRVVRATIESRQRALLNRRAEFTVSAMPMAGPPALLAVAARTTLPDAQAADDYLARMRAAPAWIDGTTDRLREGRGKGRFPVEELVNQAIAWGDRTLATPVPQAFVTPVPPEGWDGTGAWRAELEQIVRDDIMPAVARWHELLVELRPLSRPEDRAGLSNVPGGAEDYLRDIAVHTTLPLSADELHRTGLAEIERLEAQALELGASLGLHDLSAVIAAVRASAAELDPVTAIAAAQSAVRRAEARAGEMMPDPLPGPCAIEPMPLSVGESGMAPHYTRPRLDGSRPGTFWFNTVRATAGAGWDLEAVAFHETVPGHHSQLARLQSMPDLPLLQQLSITVHTEGWGLYSERLAGEFGLYSDARAELGAVYMEMHRAARLVVDTGLHAFCWSRARAITFMLDHVELPVTFLIHETDGVIAWPGQALAYLRGQREILRLRDDSRAVLGAEFDLRDFNAALLDSGSVPMPVLADIVADWVSSRRAARTG
jgi:uncharacterized protein (DUF885 family)